MGIDLTTEFGGLNLKSPIIVGACPLTTQDLLRIGMVTAGAGAIVLPSLFEEQVMLWNEKQGNGLNAPRHWSASEDLQLERARRIPFTADYQTAEMYLELVRRVSEEMPIPVIASLNGECSGIWLQFARELESAGASAIELHVRQPGPGELSKPRDMEDAIVETAESLHGAIAVPLILKLGRNYTSVCDLAERLVSKAQGIVLFGYSPQVDIHLDSFRVNTNWKLSESGSITNSLASILRMHEFCPQMSLAASGGIGSSSDLIKALLAGANVAMVTSAIYRDGPTVIGTLLEGLIKFMERHQMKSIAELKTKKPLIFDASEDRLEYIKAFSTQLKPDMVRCTNRTTEGDPWGHPRTPR